MADQKQTNSVAAAENLLSELKGRAEQAHKANDVFMMGVYSDLIKVATPVVTKAVARYHREERARVNALHTEVKHAAAAERERARTAKTPKVEA